ncbi:MAG: VOC family protein [Gammaproteobacteria bacterium]|nr:VOC family protein [Gammaproteobacteria bacterium]MCH9744474.1 VOC family protein [Gammaproteobacteria bacterium]
MKNKTLGLRHVALFVKDLEACRDFYTNLLNMEIEWQPDEDNIYLTSGNDNLALHRAKADFSDKDSQRLDHIGFIIESPEKVDEWHTYLSENNVKILMKPKTHRDGAHSFYCEDPSGNHVQMIYHPPIS